MNINILYSFLSTLKNINLLNIQDLLRTNSGYSEDQKTINNTIEIIAVKNDRLQLLLTGEGVDINDYDNSKPPFKIIVETWFEHDKDMTRYTETDSTGDILGEILGGLLEGVLEP